MALSCGGCKESWRNAPCSASRGSEALLTDSWPDFLQAKRTRMAFSHGKDQDSSKKSPKRSKKAYSKASTGSTANSAGLGQVSASLQRRPKAWQSFS